ncbi:MAG: SIS domain-containing protein [Methylococcaceae bacterium]|nr:SIS domain-containing protein [Methylococcaceae bacterium]
MEDRIFPEFFKLALAEHRQVFEVLPPCIEAVAEAGGRLLKCLDEGGKIMLCGNGGSAADAQHAAAELVVRYRKHRRALAAIALTTDTSIVTAHCNDYEFNTVFSRQIEALGRPGDCLLAISTSGNSNNVYQAVETARSIGVGTIGLLGNDGGHLRDRCDVAVLVPSKTTPRIQEAHIFILHCWCEWIENQLAADGSDI